MTNNKIRKLLPFLLSLLLLLSLVSCGNSTSNTNHEVFEKSSVEVSEAYISRGIEVAKSQVRYMMPGSEEYEGELVSYEILYSVKEEEPCALLLLYDHETQGEAYYILHFDTDFGSGEGGMGQSPYKYVPEGKTLYYEAIMGYYYKNEKTGVYHHTIASSQDIIPGEYKDPTLSS